MTVLLIVLAGCGEYTSTPDRGPVSSASMVPLTGVVTDSAGKPIPDALVQPMSLDGHPVPEIAVLSGPDGRYEWKLRPGRYSMTASKDERTGPPFVVTVEGPTTADLQVP